MALQIPQYFFITAGEVMFSVTGLEFSYSQVKQCGTLFIWLFYHFCLFALFHLYLFFSFLKAPNNMKAVLQAGWLLTVAIGNFIVLIVAEIAKLPKQVKKKSTKVLKKYSH